MTTSNDALPPDLQLAFQPLHKRALGMAVGLTCGTFVLALTVVTLLRPVPADLRIDLLAEYFAGYAVSWTGALVGFAWGFVVGFTAGWFTAFCRNLVIAASLWLTRTRAELDASRDFLDHI